MNGFSAGLLSFFLCASVFADSAPAADDVDYLRDIKPILKTKCYSCHGALKQEGNLRLDTVTLMRTGGDSGPAIAKEDAAASLILHRITAEDELERMPPEGEPLSPAQITRVAEWLHGGAPAPQNEKPQTDPASHWAFQPVETITPPSGGHPIDAFVDRRLQTAALTRSPPAQSVTLVRRMFLDLHGLPPAPKQIDQWASRLADSDNRTEVVRALIDELLTSPRYGERWAQHWLDVVRYADTHGYEVNTPRPNAWPYRDYVIDAFNNNKPYDRFIVEQLAGDTVGVDAATGFLVAAAALLPGQIGKDEESMRLARQDELDEIIVGTSATFLGLTVGCARCHDHKFDPIPQEDYYALQAFFAGVNYGDRDIRDDDFKRKVAEADSLKPKVAKLRRRLAAFQPKTFTGRTIIIDDEDQDRTTSLKQDNGHGANPAGTQRGYRDDPGDASRIGNLSAGRYTWWSHTPGEDIFTWNPGANGHFRIWLSWGVHGSGVHTRDARYVLDLDGDLATREDQTEIAQADQYYFAGITEGETEMKPVWSGVFDAGVHELRKSSRLILRGGDTGTGITADVVIFQEDASANLPAAQPRFRKPVSPLVNVERFEPVEAQFVRFTSFATTNNDRYEPCIDELEVFTTGPHQKNVAAAKSGTTATSSGNYASAGKHQLKHINDGNYGNSFSWISNERGRGWVQLQFPQTETIERIEWARDRKGEFADRLPIRYRIQTSVDGQAWKTVASSEDREPQGTPHDDISALIRHSAKANETDVPKLVEQLKELEKREAELRTPKRVFAGNFREPGDTYLLNRGDPEQPTTKLAPHVLTSIGTLQLPMEATDRERRTSLAAWVASPQNPLTARVMVNRIWQYHFGTGLVETSSDFGLNGAPPSHPELLDWLARDFIHSGWSVWHVHRLIMSSQTYQQAAARPQQKQAAAMAADAQNRLLWKFPGRRLEAEAIRDCMLSVSGQLNPAMGGPGFSFFKTRGGLSGFPPIEKFTASELRRMIYAHKIRMEPVPVFGAFDCPDAGLPTPRRSQSTTAIQALNLFNSPFVIEQADAFAQRVKAKAESTDDRVNYAARLALGRTLLPGEEASAKAAVQEHGLETLCRALFNSNEFLFMP